MPTTLIEIPGVLNILNKKCPRQIIIKKVIKFECFAAFGGAVFGGVVLRSDPKFIVDELSVGVETFRLEAEIMLVGSSSGKSAPQTEQYLFISGWSDLQNLHIDIRYLRHILLV